MALQEIDREYGGGVGLEAFKARLLVQGSLAAYEADLGLGSREGARIVIELAIKAAEGGER